MDILKFYIKFQNDLARYFNHRIFMMDYSIKLKKLIYFILIKIVKILEFLNIFSRFKLNIYEITLNYTWNLGLLQKLRIRRKKHKKIIHCIGDSHVTFFSGFQNSSPSLQKSKTISFLVC